MDLNGLDGGIRKPFFMCDKTNKPIGLWKYADFIQMAPK